MVAVVSVMRVRRVRASRIFGQCLLSAFSMSRHSLIPKPYWSISSRMVRWAVAWSVLLRVSAWMRTISQAVRIGVVTGMPPTVVIYRLSILRLNGLTLRPNMGERKCASDTTSMVEGNSPPTHTHAASEAQAMTLAGDDWRQMTPRPCTVSAGFPR